MDREFLEDCLAEGMSLERIGQLTGKHPSTVGYWLRKHGLSAVCAEQYAPRGALRRDQLEALVREGLTQREIAIRVGRSTSTVRHWMTRHGLRTVRCRRATPEGKPKRVEMRCRHHGLVEFILEGRGYYRCVRCRSEAVSKRRRVVKRTLVEEAGGRCAVCAYARCPQALQFHHLDPTLKEFHLGHQGQSRSLARSREEARKCILLCANCHAEVEAGLVELPVKSEKPTLVRGSSLD